VPGAATVAPAAPYWQVGFTFPLPPPLPAVRGRGKFSLLPGLCSYNGRGQGLAPL